MEISRRFRLETEDSNFRRDMYARLYEAYRQINGRERRARRAKRSFRRFADQIPKMVIK